MNDIKIINKYNNGDLIDYHELMSVLDELYPVKMGGSQAIYEGKMWERIKNRILELKRTKLNE